MWRPLITATLTATLMLGTTGCASRQTGDTYSRSEVRQPGMVQYGSVVSLRPVSIEGTKSPIGAAAGSIAGGIAGSTIGGGRGSAIVAVIGAVAGGLLGSAVEEGVTRANGVELIVRLKDGSERVYVQALAENERFSVGDSVRIVTSAGSARVTRM